MSMRSDEVHQILGSEDAEFRSWMQEHHEYESRLAQLAAKAVLSPEEEIEEKQLKKKKLFLKDQMADRIRHYETSHVA